MSSSHSNTLTLTPFWDESIRNNVFNFMAENPESTDDDLYTQFPDKDRETLKMFKLQYQYEQIFDDVDIRFFLGFHNEGLSTHDIETNKAMLRYIWQEKFKQLFERTYGRRSANIEDFTEDHYLTR